MVDRARSGAVLVLASLLVVTPIQALSLKDWEAKSDRDQVQYLSAVFARLVIAVGRTDQPLAQKIRSYYGDKPAGQKYPEGFLDLMQRIGRVEQQAQADRSVDLSKIELEDLVISNTADKFKGYRIAGDVLRNSGNATPDFVKAPPDPIEKTGKQPAPADDPLRGSYIGPPSPEYLRELAENARKAAAAPVMVGKVDVSHFAGLRPGDTPARVMSLYGQPRVDQGTTQWWGSSNGGVMVSYLNNVVNTVEAYSSALSFLQSRAGPDALLDLIGQTDAAAIALLGPPTAAEEDSRGVYILSWAFPMNGHPENANRATDRTLRLRFQPVRGRTAQDRGYRQSDAVCMWVSVSW